jgi:hypothetical protein
MAAAICSAAVPFLAGIACTVLWQEGRRALHLAGQLRAIRKAIEQGEL